MPKFGRAGTAVPLLIILPLLAACSPGGSDGGGGGGSSPGGSSPGWAGLSYTGNFNTAAANAFLNSSEFQAVDGDCANYGCGSSGATGNQPNAYELHNIHVAHGAGLSGAGRLIAIMDDGFRTTHQEFSDKTIYTYGTLPVESHGTHVASLAAGDRDGSGIYGVAFNAALHLTAWDTNGDSLLEFPNIIGGTLDAAAKGAVAQNNSWGFGVSAQNLANYLASNPSASVAQGLNSQLGYGASNWQSYINALNTFQNTGIIVWSLSNDEAITHGDITGALPYFETSLAEAWISVVNGYYEVDGDGNITDAVRISAACGYAAQFCVAGDGTTRGASANSNSSYSIGTGTSYVAPQVSGAVALIAEAFPSLSPAEWTDRLLASANNSWFAAQGVAVNGTTDFGNGVTHAYSNEWGHGVLDVKAALEPIGSLGVRTGGSVYDNGQNTPLDSSGVVSPAAYGDGMAGGLAGTQMAVFDALNANFTIDAGTLVHPGSSTLGSGLMGNAALVSGEAVRPAAGRSLQFTSGGLDFEALRTQNLSFGFSQSGQMQAGRSSVLGLVENAAVGTVSRDLGYGALSFFAYAGLSEADGTDFTASGFGADFSLALGDGQISISAHQLSLAGGPLGLTSSGAFDFGDQSAVTAFQVGVEQPIAPGAELFASVQTGFANASGIGGGLVSDMRDVQFSGFEAGIAFSEVAMASDRLSFSIAQPLRVEGGVTQLRLPVGRTPDGTILYGDYWVPLTPSGREIDLTLGYDVMTSETAKLSLRATYAHDLGHVAGARGVGAAASFAGRF